jgi:hypothetical protein
LLVQRSNLHILNNLGATVGNQGSRINARNRRREVSGDQICNEFKLTPLPRLLPELDELLELFGPLVEPSFTLLELPPIFAWRWTETLGGGLIPGYVLQAAQFRTS